MKIRGSSAGVLNIPAEILHITEILDNLTKMNLRRITITYIMLKEKKIKKIAIEHEDKK